MNLHDVLGDAARDAPAVEVTALAYDNRAVTPGTVFFCVPGFTRDGHEFAPDAVARGAVALVVERPLGLGVPGDPRRRRARRDGAGRGAAVRRPDRRAARGRHHRDERQDDHGVPRPRAARGRRASRPGCSARSRRSSAACEREAVRTTPEAIDLQRTFAEMRDAGDAACAMEVSSHALELRRADAIHWAAAVFTNLTQDHLDFHPTMEDYFLAKRRLFEADPAVAIVNVDDPYGARLAAELPGAVTFGIDDAGAQLRADGRALRRDGLDVHRRAAWTCACRCPAASTSSTRSAPWRSPARWASTTRRSRRALPQAGRVPGRFEPVDEGQAFAVLVDYAHTPDSLENVLRAARAAGRRPRDLRLRRGGDRDRGKRPLMGGVAADLADLAIVTSDNPRSEDPEAIVGGDRRRRRARRRGVVDRREAIVRAVALAERRRRRRHRRQGPRAGPGVRGRAQDPVRRRDGGAGGAA